MLHYLYIFTILLFSLRTDGYNAAIPKQNSYSTSVSAARFSLDNRFQTDLQPIAGIEKDILQEPAPTNSFATNGQLQRISASLSYWLHFGYYTAADIPFYRKRQTAAWIPNACKTLLLFPMHHFL